MGMHGWKHVNRAIQSADLLIAIGMRFDDRVTGNVRTYAPYARIVHVDIDPAEIGKNVAVEVPIVGDAKRVLRALTADGRRGRARRRGRDYFDQLADWKARLGRARAGTAPGRGATALLSADYVIERIGELTEHEATYVADVGQNQMWLARYTGLPPAEHARQLRRPRARWASRVPAAMGAALGRPDRETWAITGDGGFQMTFQELMTLVADHIPVKIALLDNKKLGMIRQWQEIIYAGNYHSANLPGPGLRQARRRVRDPGLPGPDAGRGRRRHPGRPGGRRPGAHLVRDRRGAERLPDDAGRQGPVRPHREVGRGGRMSGDPASNGQAPRGPAARPAAGRGSGPQPPPPPRALPGGGETRRHVLVAVVLNKPGVLNRVVEPDAGAQLQHRFARGQPHRPRRHQPDDDHPPRRRRRGRAGRQAALPADRRAQGPGRHRRADRPAGAGAGQDPRHRFDPGGGPASSSSSRAAGSSTWPMARSSSR